MKWNVRHALALLVLPVCVASAKATHTISPVHESAEILRPAAIINTPDGFALLLVAAPHGVRSSMMLQLLDAEGAVRMEHELFDSAIPSRQPGMTEHMVQTRHYATRSAIALQPDGGFLVATARSDAGGSAVWVQRTASDGSPRSASTAIADVRDATQASVRIVPLADHNLVLWISPDGEGQEELFACPIDASGHPAGEARVLVAALHHDSIASANPELDVVPVAGGFALAWAEDGRTSVDVFVQRFRTNGTPAGDRARVAGGNMAAASKPMLHPTSGGVVIAWREAAGPAMKLRASLLGTDNQLSDPVDLATGRFADAAFAGSAADPVVVTLQADRAGLSLRAFRLGRDLKLSDEPFFETHGAIDALSPRTTSESSEPVLVWSQRGDRENTQVSIARLADSR
jgi:hypothetical protein